MVTLIKATNSYFISLQLHRKESFLINVFAKLSVLVICVPFELKSCIDSLGLFLFLVVNNRVKWTLKSYLVLMLTSLFLMFCALCYYKCVYCRRSRTNAWRCCVCADCHWLLWVLALSCFVFGILLASLLCCIHFIEKLVLWFGLS